MHGMHPHMVIGSDRDKVKDSSLDRSTVRRVLAYADRYRAAGFEVEEMDLQDLFGPERFERCGLGQERYLQVVRKPA